LGDTEKDNAYKKEQVVIPGEHMLCPDIQKRYKATPEFPLKNVWVSSSTREHTPSLKPIATGLLIEKF
jgi:hypothetical protein